MLDVTRELYNSLLQERRDAYRRRRTSVSAKEQYAEITALRKPKHWIDGRLAAVYRECEDAVLHRLDLAFAAFVRRCRRGETPGFPRFKPASRWNQLEFPHGDRALRFDDRQGRVAIPGVGGVRLRKGRAVPAHGRAWVVTRNGRWYACFECERALCPLPPTGKIVGIDRGVHVLAALSDGTLLSNLAAGERRKTATARLQRELEAVTQRDSAGRVRNSRDPARIAAAMRLARSREREANARRDHAHKLGRRIVNGADVIALEKLKLGNMTRSAKGTAEQPGRNVAAKAGLNRSVLDAGFGLLRQMIVAKAEEAARTVVEVDSRFSSQECSRCGHVARESRRRRRFCCIGCGYTSHADVNAALVIRRRAQLALISKPQPAEDAGRRRRGVGAPNEPSSTVTASRSTAKRSSLQAVASCGRIA
jgi:putative transposase